MEINALFHPDGMTKAQYDEAVEKLTAAGAWPPEGQLSHTCYGEDGDLRVADVFDSRESFDAFGQILMPILADVGIGNPEPEISDIHNCRSVECA